MESKHEVFEQGPLTSSKENIPICFKRPRVNAAQEDLHETEEEQPPIEPSKRVGSKQGQLDGFVTSKYSARNNALRLVCQSNMSLHEVVSSDVVRRLLTRSYPGDPPPKSASTLSKYLKEDACGVRDILRLKFRKIRAEGKSGHCSISYEYSLLRPVLKLTCVPGHKLCCSFDEATVLGAARYITINIHFHTAIFGALRSAPLGLIRVKKRATGDDLSELVEIRLERFGLSSTDFVVAATDAGKNVLRTVDLLGLQKQKCFAHGLDLVVRKVIYGSTKKEALAFDIEILTSPSVDDEDDAVVDDFEAEDDNSESETEDDRSEIEQEELTSETEQSDVASDTEPEEAATRVCLGSVTNNLRSVVRELKRKPNLLDEIRRTTAKPEFNGEALIPKLNCPTRWYSTLVVIERAIRIHPALNNVLSRHGTPLNARDMEALRLIAEVLLPFKKAIFVLCKTESNRTHADRVFTLLLRDLEAAGTELADMLSKHVKLEIKARRTALSSVLAVLENLSYDFSLERAINQRKPSDDEMVAILLKILDVFDPSEISEDSSDSVCSRLLQIESYCFRIIV